MIPWTVRHAVGIWRRCTECDAVHAAVPGDVGTIGLCIALLRRKPLLVRHCGTWDDRSTLHNRFLAWLLPKIAGGRNVVLATGGGDGPPSARNADVRWIFSTSITGDEWKTAPQSTPWRPGVPFRLITVGRLDREKNAAAIVEAMPQLLAAGLDAELSVVGDGGYRNALARRVDELGLTPRVRFHGNVDHETVLALLAASHVFVFPTRVKEGFPKAVLEAMVCGLPILAARVSVIPHLLADDCGFLLDTPTADAVASSLRDLARNPAVLERAGRNARAKSAAYTLEAWGDRIRGILREQWGEMYDPVR